MCLFLPFLTTIYFLTIIYIYINMNPNKQYTRRHWNQWIQLWIVVKYHYPTIKNRNSVKNAHVHFTNSHLSLFCITERCVIEKCMCACFMGGVSNYYHYRPHRHIFVTTTINTLNITLLLMSIHSKK